MKISLIKKYFPALVTISLFVTISIFFLFYGSPELVINYLGVNNAYLLIFLLAFLGGLTTFSGVPYHAFVITMALGGLNPVLLGSAAASGVILGDSTSYFLGHHGHTLVPTGFKHFFQQIYDWSADHPGALPIFFLLYGSLSPFSNDFIAISAGLMRYPYLKVIIPLGIGNLIFNISLAILITHADSLLQGVLF